MSRLRRVSFRTEGVSGLEQVGHDFHAKTLPLPEHSHRGTEICYLASGEVVWLLGRRRMRLVGGMISVMQPGVAHRGEMDAIAPSDLYWAVILPGKLRPAPDAGTLRLLAKGAPYTAAAPAGLKRIFDELVEECGALRPGARASAGALATLLAVGCARSGLERNRPTSEGRPAAVEAAARRLAENLEDPPRIRDLARESGLGPTRFHAVFKQSIGLTPADYLRRARLACARVALAATAEDITALAIRLGFPSSQYFATAFRRYTGLTPSEYRRRERLAARQAGRQ
jgi:AraC-like DNA-binding protein